MGALFSKAVLRTIALVAISCGCSPTLRYTKETVDIPGEIRICVDVPKEHIPEIEMAVQQWDSALKGWKRVVAVTEEPFHRCSKVIQETTEPNVTSPNAVAWVDDIGSNYIYMLKGRYEGAVRGIALHEIGHSLGAQHVQQTLMHDNYTAGYYVCPDAVSVSQVAAWNRVELVLLTWCDPKEITTSDFLAAVPD